FARSPFCSHARRLDVRSFPTRRSSDLGSLMYTVQALWTAARESLPITTVVFANRSYAILKLELMAAASNPGPRAMGALDLAPPRSEEHTSELQSHLNLVCRLRLEKEHG